MTANYSEDANSATKDEHDASTILTVAVAINNTCASASEPRSKRQKKPVHKHEDPFMYYSHQETRMNALLLRSNDENDEQVAKESVDRKTRISFELHPSLLLDDLFLEDQYFGAEVLNGPRLQSADTSGGGDGMIEELRSLYFCVDDNDTEMIPTQ